jgi:hypothetical protein
MCVDRLGGEEGGEILKKWSKLTQKELTRLIKELELNPKQCPFSNKTNWTLRKVYEEDHTLLSFFRETINILLTQTSQSFAEKATGKVAFEKAPPLSAEIAKNLLSRCPTPETAAANRRK